MNTILRLLLPILGGLVGRALAHLFSGACPLDASSFICGHWEALASTAGVILGAFGYRVTRPGLASSKAPQRVEAPKPEPVPEPEPATSGEIVIPTREPEDLEAAQPRDQDAGG